MNVDTIDGVVCNRCGGTGKYERGKFIGSCFTCKGTGHIKTRLEAEAMPAGFNKLFDALNTARRSLTPPILREPKLRFSTFEAKLAKPGSANPGAVYVRSNQPDAAGETYLGKIVNGSFQPTTICTAEMKTAIFAAMEDPLASAILYARNSKRCSCCGIVLTDPESVRRGIGPICAEKFGF